MSLSLLSNVFNLLSNLEHTAPEEDEDLNEVSYGPFIDSLLALILPHVMLLFNGSSKKHKRFVTMFMNFCERIAFHIHLMKDNVPSTYPEGSEITRVSIKTIMEREGIDIPDEADVFFVILNHPTKNGVYISNLSKLVTLIRYLISTYLPSDWQLINVERFLTCFMQFSQPSMDVNVNDI